MAIKHKSREELLNWIMTRVHSEMKESLLSGIIFFIIKVLYFIILCVTAIPSCIKSKVSVVLNHIQSDSHNITKAFSIRHLIRDY